MHRTESENNVNNLYSDGPPGSRIGAAHLNSIQEEICYCIEQASLTVQTASADTYQQLKSAIEILSLAYVGLASGTEMWFYQDTPPTGWTLDAVPADAVLSVKGGSNAYNASGGTQAGTWTQPNHTHALAGGIATGEYSSHSHAVGTIAFPNHSHAVGTIAFPDHAHTLDFETETTTATITWGDNVYSDTENNPVNMKTATYVGGGASTLYRHFNYTQTGGGDDCTGATASDAGAACTGSTANTNGALTGATDNPSSVTNYRPLAQVGIICTKD